MRASRRQQFVLGRKSVLVYASFAAFFVRNVNDSDVCDVVSISVTDYGGIRKKKTVI